MVIKREKDMTLNRDTTARQSGAANQDTRVDQNEKAYLDATEVRAGIKKRMWPKRLGITFLILIVVACAGFYAYTSDYYHAGETATEMMSKLADSGQLQENESSIAVGDPQVQTGIILYPGAKVDPAAYVPLANEFAEKGYYCVIAKMPFNLAFFGTNKASELMDAAPDIDSWWLAGHSLGGAMGASYASSHSSDLDGMILLAAYSTSDLSASDLSVISVYGSNDGVLNRGALEENASNLPETSITEVIEGGNHAGFGDYGPQEGDGESTIGAPVQWEETASLVDEVIQKK